MDNLTRSEVKDLINRYESELRKLKYQIQRTRNTISELQKVVDGKTASPDISRAEHSTTSSKVDQSTSTAQTKPAASRSREGSRGRPPKHVLPGRENETRNGHRLNAWDQMIFDVLEDSGKALKTKNINAGVKEQIKKYDIEATDKYTRQKVAQSIHKLANTQNTLKKVDAEGRGYAYAPKEWFNAQGKLKKKHRADTTKSSGSAKSSKQKPKAQKGRPPKHEVSDGQTETRGGYNLSSWDQMIFDVIEDAGQALKTKFIVEGAEEWADNNNIDATSKYIRQKVGASIHKLSNNHKTLKKVDAEGRGYAYAPKEWMNTQGNLKKKYQPESPKKSSPQQKQKKSGSGKRGRPPKHVLPGRENETRDGHRLNAWDQMIFDVIEDSGEALKTKNINDGVKEQIKKYDIEATEKYAKQKVAQSIHKLSNKQGILKKVDAEGRGYAYAPKEWTNTQGDLKKKHQPDKSKSSKTSQSKQKSGTGQRGRPPKHEVTSSEGPNTKGGYNLSSWDQMIFSVIENAGEALKTKHILKNAQEWAEENDIDATSKYVRQKVAASIHKLSNKHKTLKKVDAEGRGYAYAPQEWVNPQGKLKKKYQSEKAESSSSEPKQKTAKDGRGRPPKHEVPSGDKPQTRGGHKLSSWDQMIFEVIEDAGEALKTKFILKGAQDWAEKHDIDASRKYIRQKVAASIHKLSNKHKTLKKVDAEGRGYAYAPQDWSN